MSAISVEQVDKSIVYGFLRHKHVLHGLNLTVEPGEVLGFIGPNGAGKSTLINLIMGFTRPDRGRVRLRGKDPRAAMSRRDVGYLPENARYYEYLTPRELLLFAGQVSGMGRAEVLAAMDPLLERVNLLAEKKRPIRTFSKGMKQRIGIALSMIHSPSLFILDEPMSGLDPLGRALVKRIILEEKEAGKTIFFSTHILNDVETLCDRIAVIHRGRILYKGTVEAFMQGRDDLEACFVDLLKAEEEAGNA